MPIPLEDDLHHYLSALAIPTIGPDHQIWIDLDQHCVAFSKYLERKIHTPHRHSLAGRAFGETDEAHVLDAILHDVFRIANQLAYAIALSYIYLDTAAEKATPGTRYAPTVSDGLFWYHVDFGFRLASSGWDRLALLLDLAFDTGTDGPCKLGTVLDAIARKDPSIAQDLDYGKFVEFRHSSLSGLATSQGDATLDEPTHLISPGTRWFFERREGAQSPGSPGTVPADQIKALVMHHERYLEGIQIAGRLVAAHWPSHWDSLPER
jgi:hypothetical protein